MDTKAFFKNLAIIAIIFVVLFLSQLPYFRQRGNGSNGTYSQGIAQLNSYWLKANDWVKAYLGPKVSREVAKDKVTATQEFTKQKDYLVQNIWEKIKNYFAQKFSAIFGTKVK